jgi:hypothetical protein
VLANAEDNPSKFAAQSITMASSSVQAGLHDHYRGLQKRINLRVIKQMRTLKPGLVVLEEYSSPKIPSNVQAVGKYAKKEGCCQWVNPIKGPF